MTLLPVRGDELSIHNDALAERESFGARYSSSSITCTTNKVWPHECSCQPALHAQLLNSQINLMEEYNITE